MLTVTWIPQRTHRLPRLFLNPLLRLLHLILHEPLHSSLGLLHYEQLHMVFLLLLLQTLSQALVVREKPFFVGLGEMA